MLQTTEVMMLKTFMRVFGAFHVFFYRLSSGKIGRSMRGAPVLLLTSVGRRSGREITMPLGYFDVDGQTVLVASNGGLSKHPGWYYNLQAHPQVTVQIQGERRAVRAEQIDDAGYDRVWSEVIRQSPPYAAYVETAARRIPLFRMTPA